MKKQLFSFLMVLALVVLAGTSAFAQAGLTPGNTYEIAIGSSATFEVASQTGNTYDWDVFELASDHIVGAAKTASVDGSKVTIASPTSNSTLITFYAMPSGTNVFVVEVKEQESAANGSCSTVRRFYVSLFNFDVQVIALSANVDAAPATPAGTAFTGSYPALAECNSWSGDVIKNTIDSLMLASMRADSVDNPTNGHSKYTDSYFAIRLYLEGGASLANYRSRFQWSMDSTSTSTSIYSMSVVNGPARFISENGSADWNSSGTTAAIATPTAWADANFSTEQTMYIPRQTGTAEAISVVRVRTHNLAGAADMKFNMKIDRVQLEKDATAGTYNNGEKYNNHTNAASTTVARLDGSKDISSSITIRQSPATAIIDVVD